MSREESPVSTGQTDSQEESGDGKQATDSIHQAFYRAASHLQNGQLQQAETVLLEIQREQLDSPEVLHQLAYI